MDDNSQIHFQEEILEHLWVCLYEDDVKNDKVTIDLLKKKLKDHNFDVKSLLEALHLKGEIILQSKNVYLTEKGKIKGEQVVRRHRLAERLFTDILDISPIQINAAACQFEHVLNEDVEESICTILGHPFLCPHEKKIPKGNCCKKKNVKIDPIVTSLEYVESDSEAIIAYIATSKREYSRLQKLMGFGILPGTKIRILRKTPATVIKVDEIVLALEPDVNKSIFLRKVKKI